LLRPSLRPGGAPRPALAIWSRSGELPDYLDPDQPTYLLTPSAGAKDAARRSGLPAAQVLAADSPQEAVEALAARGLRLIQAEGGPSALARLAEAELLDELCFTTAHRTVGGPSPRVLDGAAHETRWTLESLLLGEGATLSRYRRARAPPGGARPGPAGLERSEPQPDRPLERGRGRIAHRHLERGGLLPETERIAEEVGQQPLVPGGIAVPLAGVGGALEGLELDEVRPERGEMPARGGGHRRIVEGVEEEGAVAQVTAVVGGGHLVQRQRLVQAHHPRSDARGHHPQREPSHR